MEWLTCQHLDLRSPSLTLGAASIQAQCAAFHPTQALLAVAVGRQIIEFDVLSGCKLSNVDIGGSVVRMAYSPSGGHIIVAVLEDWTIRSWDLDTEHTSILYSPLDRKSQSGGKVEVHIALTPLKPWLFFGAHRRTSVNVVGTIEGVRPAQKIKTDVKKPITILACHPRSPLLYVGYADGILRAYNILTWAVQYTLAVDPSMKLLGPGAVTFHSVLDIVFVGDHGGTLLAYDVSNITRPALAGSFQISTTRIVSVAWHATMQMLLTLVTDGVVEAWRVRTISSTTSPVMRGNFFEPAGVERLDVAAVLLQEGGEAVYPVPRVVELLVHPRFNAATILFADSSVSGGETAAKRAANMNRDGRKQLLAMLQGARGGSGGGALKERLAALGSANILSEYQLQQQQLMQLQARGASKIGQPTLADHARKAFLYGNPKELHASSGPVKTLPLLSIADPGFPLRDLPVCQPFQLECDFFSIEHGVFVYPPRVDYMDGCNLTGYNLASRDTSVFRKLAPMSSSGAERAPRHIVYSAKQQVWLIFFECRGTMCEAVLVRNRAGLGGVGEKEKAVAMPGRDGAFTGYNDDQFVILDEDGLGLKLYALEGAVLKPVEEPPPAAAPAAPEPDIPPEIPDVDLIGGGLDPNDFAEPGMYGNGRGRTRTVGAHALAVSPDAPLQFMFETPVQRVFPSPQEYSVLYVVNGSHMGLARLSEGSMGSNDSIGGQLLLHTRMIPGRSLKLKPMEYVLQVRWQETKKGPVAAVVTTMRVLLLSLSLDIIASTSARGQSAYPPFRTCMWVGPALLFTTATAVVLLGWDGIQRPVMTLDTPHGSLLGALNDRLLLACRTGAGSGGPTGVGLVEVRTRMVGLLEPLLIGWATLQQFWDQSVDLKETFYKLTSRFDSLRMTPRTADVLVLGPPVCADLAVELAQSGPQFTQELRCSYAIRARRFPTALSVLKDEFVRSKDYPRCPPTSRLFQRFRELGRACIRYGQFDRAKETFETAGDFESMFDLFIGHQNPSALRRLVQKIEESQGSPELKRLCDKLLQIRSIGWGQGGVLASLAGESMLPKPAEWGGGNWELREGGAEGSKTPTEWELSGEVTAYMKTSGAAGTTAQVIPNVIPDSLGVLLGTERGRGAIAAEPIAKFRSGSLDNSSFGMGSFDGEPASFNSRGSRPGSTLDGASPELSRKSALRGSTAGSSVAAGGDEETDEQARAAAEFKRGMYGAADYSSSGEEDESAVKKTKIRIRIRDKKDVPQDVTTDVNMLRESTQKLKLGEGGSSFVRKGRIGAPLTPLSHRQMSLDSPTSSVRDGFSSRRGSGEGSDFLQRGGGAPIFGAAGASDIAALDLGLPGGGVPPPQQPPMGFQRSPVSASFGSVQDLVGYGQGVYRTPLNPSAYGGQPYPPPVQYMPHQAYAGSQVPLGPGGIPDLDLPGGGVPPQQLQGMGPGSVGAGAVDSANAALDLAIFGSGVPPLPPGAGAGMGPGGVGMEGGATPPMSTDLGSFTGGSAPNSVGGGGLFYTPPVSVSGTPQAMGAAVDAPPQQQKVLPGQVPRGAPASTCFKTGLTHIEQNELADAAACFDEAFVALRKDTSMGKDIAAQAKLTSQYKIAVMLLLEIAKLQKADQAGAVGAKEEMARLARHLGSLQLQAKHRISCIRTAVKRNMDVQNYLYSKNMLDLLLSKAPGNKQAELRGLVSVCVQRGLTDRAIDGQENASMFCAATYGRLPTIGHDSCDVCGANFSTSTHPLCTICGLGKVKATNQQSSGVFASPF